MARDASILEALVNRDRQLVLAELVTVMALSWLSMVRGVGMGMTAFEMSPSPPGHGSGMGETLHRAQAAMTQPAVWTSGYAGLMFVIWWVMRVAVMLPSSQGSPPRRLAARRGAAERSLDRQIRMGYGRASEAFSRQGLGTAGFGKLGGHLWCYVRSPASSMSWVGESSGE